MQFSEIIKAIIIDIDGCLSSKTFGQPLDIDSLTKIQSLSKQSINDPSIPMFILNTGRDFNHTELMAKILDAFNYFIIEMGAAVVSIHGSQITFNTHSSINEKSLKELEQLRMGFLSKYPQYWKYLQYGKQYMITFLFENDDPIIKKFNQDFKNFLTTQDNSFIIDEGHNFTNIVFKNINKGSSLDILFKLNSELNHKNTAGIGDSTGDWSFMERCAFSACPSNSSEFLKNNCSYVSNYPEAEGTLEIIEYIIKRNKALYNLKIKTEKKPKSLIKTIICDINGSIDSNIFGNSIQLDKIKKIRSYIQYSKNDPAIPNIILNTGWDINYTVLYAQLLNTFQYHIVERGAAIISIDGSQIHINVDPNFTSETVEKISHIRKEFIRENPQYNKNLQVGKKYMISFQFEVGSLEKNICKDKLINFLEKETFNYDLEEGDNFLNIGLAGINKGTALKLLTEIDTTIQLENVLGIGDSNGDWDFISKCGYKACPSNASKFLRDRCDYVSNMAETSGVIEIIDKIIQWNLDLL